MTPAGRRLKQIALFVGLLGAVSCGCQAQRRAKTECPTPTALGLNVRDIIDKPQQEEVESLIDLKELGVEADKYRKEAVKTAEEKRNPAAPPWKQKNILCLSGGGSYGAFTAGVLCGWTAKGKSKGERPPFDVVTGISTGALIAPFAFLGSAYDDQMKAFYTTNESKDLYKVRPIRGFFGEALADNSKLAAKVDCALSPQVMAELAEAHRKGRRLYIGTTEAESKRFVIWDIGAIAVKGRPEDRLVIKQILLASSAIPGFFPPQHITLDLEGECITEKHLDGGVSQAIFMRGPYLPPEHRSLNGNHDLAGHNLYCIVAGKLYIDPQPLPKFSVAIAAQEVSAVIYAQTRGDLQRMANITMLTGMNFYMTSIPIEYPAPATSTAFEIPALVGMFNEGYRIMIEDKVWRKGPPNRAPGENANERAGTSLTYKQRGPYVPPGPRNRPYLPFTLSEDGIPMLPPMK